MAILLLTKSLSFEQKFVQELNSLGHEVFCSKQFFKELQNVNQLALNMDYFETVILSETFSDQEVQLVLNELADLFCTIFRKTNNELSIEKQKRWNKRGILEFISKETTFDELREKIVAHKRKNEDHEQNSFETVDRSISLMCQNFSKQELKVFNILQQAKGSYTSRESLCYELWHDGVTNSRESRLSGITKSIKKKMHEAGFDDSCLETSWGHGYRLAKLSHKKSHTEISEKLVSSEY